MGFHLFAKTVYDADLCFIRDLVELGYTIDRISSTQTMRTIIMGIIDKHKLKDKLVEFTENGHYKIEDCYYTDTNKKMSCARDMLCSCNEIPFINDSEKTQIRAAAIECLKRWNFSRNEKIQLIKECICPPNCEGVVGEYIINLYLDLF